MYLEPNVMATAVALSSESNQGTMALEPNVMATAVALSSESNQGTFSSFCFDSLEMKTRCTFLHLLFVLLGDSWATSSLWQFLLLLVGCWQRLQLFGDWRPLPVQWHGFRLIVSSLQCHIDLHTKQSLGLASQDPQLCPLPSALCPLPSTLCPLPSTLYHMPSILCPLPSFTLYPLPSALYHLFPTLYPRL
jgi:hypothetical protein